MAKRIFGVSLVRNEDYVVAWAIGNVVDFVDHLLVLDNRSTDRTRQILDTLAARHRNIEVVEVRDAFDTHRFVEPWAGDDLWVLKVDGDEIYNHDGLARLRPRLLAGEFDAFYSVDGPSIHPTAGALRGAAFGYTAPPAKSVARILNFGAMIAWPPERRDGRIQRMHGEKAIRFKHGYSVRSNRMLHEGATWEACDLRVAHMCFVPRSSDRAFDQARPNPRWANLLRDPVAALAHGTKRLMGRPTGAAAFKLRSYARGEPGWRSMDGFGGPLDYVDVDPDAAEAERVLTEALAQGSLAGESRA